MAVLSIVLYLIAAFFILCAISGSVTQKNSPSKKGLPQIFFTCLLFGAIFCVFGWWVWPSNDTSEKTVTEKQKSLDFIKKMPIEQTLASLDAGQIVPDTSLKVIRIKVLLNRISIIYNEPVDSIAELTSKAQGAIHDEGISESCANILENMYQAGKVKDVKYKEALTLYAYLKIR